MATEVEAAERASEGAPTSYRGLRRLMTRSRENNRRSDKKRTGLERRRWDRIPVAIPVFVRSADASGKEFREFTTALNISPGGALLATQHEYSASSRFVLEIPSAPLPALRGCPHVVRSLPVEIVNITQSGRGYLCGLKFSRPLLKPATISKRKSASPV